MSKERAWKRIRFRWSLVLSLCRLLSARRIKLITAVLTWKRDFFQLYTECETGLQQILATQNRIAIQSGEGMLALWGALKSVLQPGNRVLAVATGCSVMAWAKWRRSWGCRLRPWALGMTALLTRNRYREAAQRFRAHMITAVHCETPSGTLNPLAEIGAISREVDALFYVDFVASGGGVPVLVDDWHIDLGLLGQSESA